MNKSLLLTRPDHDPLTNYLYYWCEKIIEQAQKSGVKVIDLDKKRANNKEFTSVIRKTNPSLVSLNGHGDDKTVRGFNNEVLIKAGVNEQLFAGKIVYVVACRSAKTLGPSSIKNGTKAYIGYDDDFVLMYDENKITRPLEDKTAELFLEPSNIVVISLLKGNNARDSHLRSKEDFKKKYQALMITESPQVDKEALPWLWWDMNHQVCLGDPNAQI
jgi:hypothetical protein